LEAETESAESLDGRNNMKLTKYFVTNYLGKSYSFTWNILINSHVPMCHAY